MKEYLSFYKRMGFSVIPITAPTGGFNDGKKPAIPSWLSYTTRKPSDHELDKWFNGTNLNIAVVTGEISDLNVLDIDDEDSYEKIMNVAPWFEETLTVKTGKGYHIYFRPSVHTRTTTFTINDHLHHIKAEGGYVVAPPSTHASGRKYAWHIETAPSRFNVDDVVAAILNAGAVFKAVDTRSNRKLAWASELCEVNAEGSRNTRAAQLCGLLIRFFRRDPGLILGLMKAWNHEYCKPPLPEDEIERLVEGEYRRYSEK